MIEDFLFARDIAHTKNLWVVIVVPSDLYAEALDTMAAVSNGHPFGGRTMDLAPGRLSLAQTGDDPFPSEPFVVSFVGWGNTKLAQAQEMTRWKDAATRVLSRAT